MDSEQRQAIQAFLEQHPDVEFVDLLIPDSNGLMRGKRVEVENMDTVVEDGVCLPGSIFGTNIEGDTVEATGLGFDVGDEDLVCRPLPHTLAPVPWRDTPSAQVLISMHRTDGEPFFAEPRHLLERVQQGLAEQGLRPVVAVELEFYLTDKDTGPRGEPLAPRSPVSGQRETATQVYGMTELEDYEELVRDIRDACYDQKIPAHTVVSEYAPGQYEVNLQHVEDACVACDHAVMLKRLIKGVAARHGFGATFMAKPFPEQTGSGTHIHCSLLDADGNNVFANGDREGTARLRHAVGGLLERMDDSWLLFAPNANSYRRFVANAYVPMTPTWGYNNRTVAVRIPSGPAHATRIEHRVAGADANPYLVTAAVLAAMTDGMRREVEPPEPVEGDAIKQFPPEDLPNWKEAMDRFVESEFLRAAFGEDWVDLYYELKYDEMECFAAHITALEYAWYLKSV